LLRHMSHGRCAAVLKELGYRQAAALLRIQDPDRRAAIFAELPGRLASSFTRSLAYQAGSVGAWIDMSAPYFQKNLSAAECLGLLARQRQRFGSSLVVVDQHHRVYGVVELDALLVCPRDSSLEQLADTGVEPISAEMSLQVVKSLEAWQRYSALPVRDRNLVYLGSLSRVALGDALARQRESGATGLNTSLVGHLARALAVTCSGLFQMSGDRQIGWEQNSKGKRDDD